MSQREPATVVVTGASGYVGTELTKQLLDQGYTVRATARDPAKNKFLTALGDALPGKLELWSIDMRKDGAFDEIVQGAKYVFHCASVVNLGSGDVEKDRVELVEPAINGTINIMSAVAKSKTLKRLVITSSIAAIRNPDDDRPGRIFTDKDFSDSCTIESHPYFVSKREGEKKAWEMAKDSGIDLVTINPSMIVGPVVTGSKGGFSVDSVKELLEGKPVQESIKDYLHIDVRDVARAHILAAEIPEANGRYILSHEQRSNRKDIAALLQKSFPDFPIQSCDEEPTTRIFDTSKLKELGIDQLIPLQKSFLDQARCTVALNLVSPQ